MGERWLQTGAEHPVEAHAGSLLWLVWGFWIVAIDLGWGGGVGFDPLNDTLGHALILTGLWRLRQSSAEREHLAEAAARFTLTLWLVGAGLVLGLADYIPDLFEQNPILEVLAGLTATLAGWSCMSALAIVCDRFGAGDLARSWTLSSRLWLWFYLPLDLLGLAIVATTNSSLHLETPLALLLILAMLAPVAHAHASMLRMRGWRPLPIVLDCPRCGYSLSGLPGPECPECGLPFEAMGGAVWTEPRSGGAADRP